MTKIIEYQYFGYIHSAIFSFLFRFIIYITLHINKYIIVKKKIMCEKNAALKFPCNKFITHLVPPHPGHKIPVF